MKKSLFIIIGIVVFSSCTVGVEEHEEKDSASRFDSGFRKLNTRVDAWGDSAKEKYKDIKNEVKDRMDKDSSPEVKVK